MMKERRSHTLTQFKCVLLNTHALLLNAIFLIAIIFVRLLVKRQKNIDDDDDVEEEKKKIKN